MNLCTSSTRLHMCCGRCIRASTSSIKVDVHTPKCSLCSNCPSNKKTRVPPLLAAPPRCSRAAPTARARRSAAPRSTRCPAPRGMPTPSTAAVGVPPAAGSARVTSHNVPRRSSCTRSAVKPAQSANLTPREPPSAGLDAALSGGLERHWCHYVCLEPTEFCGIAPCAPL